MLAGIGLGEASNSCLRQNKQINKYKSYCNSGEYLHRVFHIPHVHWRISFFFFSAGSGITCYLCDGTCSEPFNKEAPNVFTVECHGSCEKDILHDGKGISSKCNISYKSSVWFCLFVCLLAFVTWVLAIVSNLCTYDVLMYHSLGKFSRRQIDIFFLFDISCKLFPFPGKNKKINHNVVCWIFLPCMLSVKINAVSV